MQVTDPEAEDIVLNRQTKSCPAPNITEDTFQLGCR